MLPRLIGSEIRKSLEVQAAVALIGPRQVGKTTLALEIGEDFNAVYLDLENSDDRAKLQNPKLFLEGLEDRLVILDEIHLLPEIFQVLRGIIDRGRRKNLGTGRFLLLGSASWDLLKQSESLAGRISYIDMGSLTVLEVASLPNHMEQLWLRGGLPDSFLSPDDQASFGFRKNFIRAYLQREVPSFGFRIPATTLERLWTMLAHRQGTLLNCSQLAKSLEVSTQSVSRYIDLLADLLMVRKLLPYHANIGKRLVKSPKVYVRDSGLVHALLGITNSIDLAGHPVSGMSWEGFVIENLISVLPWGVTPFFYRTSAGAEIDLLLEFTARKELWAIEIKRSPSAKLEKGFHHARADLEPNRSFLVHATEDRFPLATDVEAIGIVEMMNLLRHA